MSFELGEQLYLGSAGPFRVVAVDTVRKTVRMCSEDEWKADEWQGARDEGMDWGWDEVSTAPGADS
jgi:hypothetical protein